MNRKNNSKKNDKINNIARYSGLAFEMLGFILLGVFGGKKLDKIWDLYPVFTIIGSLAGVAFSLIVSLRDLINRK
jgi:F0F1-type ATP synthase assembly protein I